MIEEKIKHLIKHKFDLRSMSYIFVNCSQCLNVHREIGRCIWQLT